MTALNYAVFLLSRSGSILLCKISTLPLTADNFEQNVLFILSVLFISNSHRQNPKNRINTSKNGLCGFVHEKLVI